ncbi:aminomethyltransferase family protein [Nocardioides mangrovi]|uniref:Aminomethyltransferase family protein n=1 Tax=Nocardioides mangrovi TaxID=2874580 RepID=A0ABS7UIC4_9ACTN|nr:aminomethyltransferase family protein [Nocardioides mangrovi]MBZ5740043.1 aminomethyltransferase family protein [Nocardioides mangrovi]MBZ5740786.1 aminomethyltransferase family protein [Nocardioides mangrovi]
MIRTTPFHPRLSELNSQQLYTHWQGTLSPLRYSHAPKHEYFAVRNGVGVFDTSPLYKYAVRGPDAERLLSRTLVRDVRTCRPGQAHYTAWCDDRGYVMHDGVVFRHSADEFLLTAGRPALSWFQELGSSLRVELEDVTDAYGMLAVQGPRSRAVLAALAPEAETLGYFDHVPAKVADAAVTLSRTGYTGDLGFELTVAADDAVAVLDAVLDAGRPHSIRPFGEEALMTLRIEAGLPLVDIEWHDARLAFTEADCVTPKELGLGWMLRGVRDGSRRFVGSEAIRRELVDGTSRWATTGIVVDPDDWDRLYRRAGLFPPKSEHPLPYESMLLDDDPQGGHTEIGYCTSFVYSPALQRHIGIARVRPDLAAPGTGLRLELAINHHNTTVRVATTPMPFFEPDRKKS